MLVKILVVEDNEVTGKFLNSILSEKGYQVKVLNEGSGVVDMAKIFNPHLILMDILLSDMDGADVVKMLQREPRTAGIPVIFLSAIAEQDEHKNSTVSVNERFYPALSKSITTNDLLNTINQVLKK